MNNYFFEIDFQKDLWEWYQTYDAIKDHKILVNDPLLDKIQAQIIKNKDAGQAYFFAYHFKYKTHLMQQVVIASKSAKYCFTFAKEIPKADIKALQQVIFNTNNTKYICYFGLSVPGANIAKSEQYIIKSGQAKYACMWIKGAAKPNIKKIKPIIL